MKLFTKNQQPGGPKGPRGSQFFQNLLSVVLFLLLISTLYSMLTEDRVEPEQVSLTQVADALNEGDIASIAVKGDTLDIELLNGDLWEAKKEREASFSETMTNYGVPPVALSNAEISVEKETGVGIWLLNFLPIILPLIFIVGLFWYLSRQMRNGPGMKAFTFGQSRARVTDPDKQSVTFKDVAGVKEAKEELLEVVDFLKHPKKFLDIGARIPKGVLLMGQPGTGKTLLARAVAGEAKVPFFHLSGSEFVEMFVGVGASRVRDLFTTAKRVSPAIIFIDEIDAVGRHRGAGIGGGNDEREQTLNQILVEMDGFEPNDKLIVIAATNRPDVLDPALLRPGRFDRRVILDAPDREDRAQILKIHGANKPLAEDVNLALVAERTPGFSGADLQSLMNEAAILAARENRKKVAQYDIIRSIEKVMIGPERKSHLHTKKERKIVAYHEAGHAVLASVLPDADPVHKVSIVARGRAGGYTLKLPLEERKLESSKEFLADMTVALGGYVTEKMMFGDVTTGPSGDIQVITRMARAMVTRYGMSDKIGPIALEDEEGNAMYGAKPGSTRSESIQKLVDDEVSRLVSEAMKLAEEKVHEHKKLLDAIALALLEHETLEQEDYNAILMAHGIVPKRREKEAVEPIASETDEA